MIHTPATVLLGSGFFHRSHDLRSPWATDTLDFWYYWHSRVQHCYCCRYSLSYHWVIAADKQWGSSCCHTLTHVHMQHLTWKERKLCGTGSLAAADGLRYSRSAETAVCPSGATSGTAEKVHKWSENLANHKSSHCPSVTPRSRVFFYFYLFFITRRIHDLTPWTPAHSGVTHAHTCQCIDLSISLHLVCGNEEVGATEMISLKIPMSSGRVPGFSVTRFMVKSSKNSAKTLRTLL